MFNHLTGTIEVEAALALRPTITAYRTQDQSFDDARVLQVLFEIDSACMQRVLPPALHPSIPGHVALIFLAVDAGPFGPFRMAQVAVGCRSGTKPRNFLVGAAIDNPGAAAAFEAGWGFRCLPGDVVLDVGYDRIAGRVELAGHRALDVQLVDPEPLAGGAVKYGPILNLATTPDGPQLVQVDADYRFTRIERGRPALLAFDAGAWGDGQLRPTTPVAATLASADVTLHGVQWLLDPFVPAAEGVTLLSDRDEITLEP